MKIGKRKVSPLIITKKKKIAVCLGTSVLKRGCKSLSIVFSSHNTCQEFVHAFIWRESVLPLSECMHGFIKSMYNSKKQKNRARLGQHKMRSDEGYFRILSARKNIKL